MTFTFDPKEFLDRAASKIGFSRDRYIENNIPTDLRDVAIFFSFGDMKSEFLLSSLLLKNYIKKIRRPRYSILCSYKGHQSLYPYVDEYWSINANIELKKTGFDVKDDNLSMYESNLLRYFPGEVINCSIFNQYYNNGFTSKYFSDYKDLNYYLPSIPSVTLDMAKKLSNIPHTVFLYPTKKMQMVFNRKKEAVFILPKFWEELTVRIISEGITPIVYIDSNSYDISPSFGAKCIYMTDTNIMNVLAVMRTSCVIDIGSGISRFALIARAPYLCVDSRQHYFDVKENELDDLCGSGIPKNFAFVANNSFENDWAYVIERTVFKCKELLSKIDRTKLMSCSEFDDNINYDVIRNQKVRKLGLHFIKVNQEVI